MRITNNSVIQTAIILFLCTGMITVGMGAVAGDHKQQENRTGHSNSNTATSATIDCNQSKINVTAPEGYRYRLTVAIVNITPSTSSTERSTVTPITGNTTVNFTGSGAVFVFVQNESAAEKQATTSVEYCTAAGELGTTVAETGDPSDQIPRVEIDCNESRVQFVVPDDKWYTVSIAMTSVSPTSTSTNRVTKTFHGNATEPIDATGLIAVFASSGRLGDDQTVSAVHACGYLNQSQMLTETSESLAKNQNTSKQVK